MQPPPLLTLGPTNGFREFPYKFPRQENQRLNRHVQEMRYELSTNAESGDTVARGEARHQRRVSKARSPEAWQLEMNIGET